jgi:hypothetical protein
MDRSRYKYSNDLQRTSWEILEDFDAEGHVRFLLGSADDDEDSFSNFAPFFERLFEATEKLKAGYDSQDLGLMLESLHHIEPSRTFFNATEVLELLALHETLDILITVLEMDFVDTGDSRDALLESDMRDQAMKILLNFSQCSCAFTNEFIKRGFLQKLEQYHMSYSPFALAFGLSILSNMLLDSNHITIESMMRRGHYQTMISMIRGHESDLVHGAAFHLTYAFCVKGGLDNDSADVPSPPFWTPFYVWVTNDTFDSILLVNHTKTDSRVALLIELFKTVEILSRKCPIVNQHIFEQDYLRTVINCFQSDQESLVEVCLAIIVNMMDCAPTLELFEDIVRRVPWSRLGRILHPDLRWGGNLVVVLEMLVERPAALGFLFEVQILPAVVDTFDNFPFDHRQDIGNLFLAIAEALPPDLTPAFLEAGALTIFIALLTLGVDESTERTLNAIDRICDLQEEITGSLEDVAHEFAEYDGLSILKEIDGFDEHCIHIAGRLGLITE